MPAPPRSLQHACRQPSADTPNERIALIQQQLAVSAHIGLPTDKRRYAIAVTLVITAELAADHARLAPDLTRLQFAVGRQTGQFGAGAGPAG